MSGSKLVTLPSPACERKLVRLVGCKISAESARCLYQDLLFRQVLQGKSRVISVWHSVDLMCMCAKYGWNYAIDQQVDNQSIVQGKEHFEVVPSAAVVNTDARSIS